jgi:hypothetical protein
LGGHIPSPPAPTPRVELWRRGRDHFVVVRSKQGAEGIAVTNGRDYLHPILNHLVIPNFLGKDAQEWGLPASGNCLKMPNESGRAYISPRRPCKRGAGGEGALRQGARPTLAHSAKGSELGILNKEY